VAKGGFIHNVKCRIKLCSLIENMDKIVEILKGIL
jgi:hypothetical protein